MNTLRNDALLSKHRDGDANGFWAGYAINLSLRLYSIVLKYPSIFFLICFTWLGAKPSGFLVGWSVVSGAVGCKLLNVNRHQSIYRSLTFQNTRNFISKIDLNLREMYCIFMMDFTAIIMMYKRREIN